MTLHLPRALIEECVCVAAHKHMPSRNACFVLNNHLGRIIDLTGNADIVNQDKGQSGSPVIQDQASCVQFVVDVLSRWLAPVSDNRFIQRRRNIARRGSGTKDAGLCLDGLDAQGENKQYQNESRTLPQGLERFTLHGRDSIGSLSLVFWK